RADLRAELDDVAQARDCLLTQRRGELGFEQARPPGVHQRHGGGVFVVAVSVEIAAMRPGGVPAAAEVERGGQLPIARAAERPGSHVARWSAGSKPRQSYRPVPRTGKSGETPRDRCG